MENSKRKHPKLLSGAVIRGLRLCRGENGWQTIGDENHWQKLRLNRLDATYYRVRPEMTMDEKIDVVIRQKRSGEVVVH